MEYIVFGTTAGFSNTETTPEEQRFIEQFYRDDTGRRTCIHKCYNDKVYYTHTIYTDAQRNFCDSIGRPGAFLGIMLGFDKHYCRDWQKIEHIFENIYQNLIKKGYILETKTMRKFMISDFSSSKQGIHEAVEDAVLKENLNAADLEPFRFNELKGTYRCNPKDMPALNKSLMDMPYNIDISTNYPTQAILRAQKTNLK
ncbi:MAG: hypothetical protein J5895_01410 [Alphaproteobacteria bacterium]|nr:hypothetical protein [Alphaproteobacteria bacterium]